MTRPIRRRTGILASCVTGILVASLIPLHAAQAAPVTSWDPYGEGLQNSNASLGYPTFVGADKAIPDSGVGITAERSYLQQVFEKDIADGRGTAPLNDFWVDKLLVRQGVQPDEPGGRAYADGAPQNIDYDNNGVLFTRGRALYMEDSTAGLGFRGDVAYIDSLGGRDAYTLALTIDGQDITLNEDQSKRHNAPSYWYSEFTGGGVKVAQTKFIDQQNVLVEWLQVQTTDGSTKNITITGRSPYAQRVENGELVGSVTAPHNVTQVTPRLSGADFSAADGAISRTVAVNAAGADVKVQMAFITAEIPESTSTYDRIREQAPAEAFTEQTTTYNKWWADTVPYLDTPSPELDKSFFYRWWLLRTNFLDANIPGNDYQFPTTIEGVYGAAYNNAIVLTVGMFVDDLKYFRDPSSAYGSWVSAGEVARSQQYIDNPGNPVNWSASYANFISQAAWESYRVHGGDPAIAAKLAQYASDDVAGQLEQFDGNGNGLLEYTNPAWTGNDVDAVSFSWRGPHAWESLAMDRPESAYVYAGAQAAAEAYRLSGNTADADRMDQEAQRIKDSVLDVMWEDKRATPDEAGLYGNLIKGSYSLDGFGVRAGDKIPWKEVNMYYPYTVGLMPKPGDPDFDEKYLDAFRLFVDSSQYSPFPFFTANQKDAASRARAYPDRRFSNNFSTINSTVMFRLLSSALRDYPNDYLTSDYYKKLLYWNAWASYEKGDVSRQNENEFWAWGTPDNGGDIDYRSWIHQTQLGTTNFTVIEDVMGLQARTDDKIEVSPVDIDWGHFAANNLRYHGKDVSIVWDKPGDGTTHYDNTPEGYSVYIDGQRAFTLDSLAKATYDPATGQVDTDATVTYSRTGSLTSADQVSFADDSRVVDVFAKAGVDVKSASAAADNIAEGARVQTSYAAPGQTPAGNAFAAEGAVDGSTVNEPFWGTAGSLNESDWIEIDLDTARPVDEAQVFFYRSSSSATTPGYAAPSRYIVEYWDGDAWKTVTQQARFPQVPAANQNVARFDEVTASKFRVKVSHQVGSRTGVKEVQLRDTGIAYEPVGNVAPVITLNRTGAEGAPRATFTGSVADDGLPAGTLTQQWTVESKPENARVVFGSTTNVNTSAAFSEPGNYRLVFTASDGELTSTTPVDITVTGELPPGPDITANARVSASYTAGWNNTAALTNGTIVSTGDAPQQEVWGTYRDGARPSSDAVTYTWDTPQRVAGASAWFWGDRDPGTGGNVSVPQSWTVEYQDQTGAWKPVTASAYPVNRSGEESRVTFDSVQTSAVRVTLNASPGNGNYSAVGMSELDVYTDTPASVDALALRTPQGTPVNLPATATVMYADGKRADIPVVWDAVDPARYNTPGRFDVRGVFPGSLVEAVASISVGDSGSDVQSIEALTTVTRVGVAPDLPRTAVAVFAGGTGARESRPVTWDTIDPAQYAQTGSFTVQGRMEGTSLRPAVTVTVEERPGGEPPAQPGDLNATATANEVTASWAAVTSTSTVGSYTVKLTPHTGGNTITQTVQAPTTTAKFGAVAPGDYRVSVVATSPAGSAESGSVTVHVSAAPAKPVVAVNPSTADGNAGWYKSAPTVTATPASGAIAHSAVPTAPYTAAWNRIGAVNDGKIFYIGGAQMELWGGWAPQRPAQRELDYTWAVPKTLTSTKVHFWTDTAATNPGDGVASPAAWKLQYKPQGADWTDVPGVAAYPIGRGAASTVTFPAVTTTALRLVMQAQTNGTTFAGVAVSEWEVFGYDAGDRVQVRNGEQWPDLPKGGLPIAAEGADVQTTLRTVTSSAATSEPEVSRLRIDRTAPSVAVKTANGTAGQQAATVELTATDATSGVARLQYRVGDSGNWLDVTKPITFPAAGTHVIGYRAIDNAGNETQASVSAETVAPALTAVVSATSRCVSNRVVLTVTVKNTNSVPISAAIETPHGSRSVPSVEPAHTVSHAVTTRQTRLAAGEVAVQLSAVIDGKTVQATQKATYAARSCG